MSMVETRRTRENVEVKGRRYLVEGRLSLVSYDPELHLLGSRGVSAVSNKKREPIKKGPARKPRKKRAAKKQTTTRKDKW